MPAVLWVIVQGGLVYLGVVIVFVVLGQREFYHLIEEKGWTHARAWNSMNELKGALVAGG